MRFEIYVVICDGWKVKSEWRDMRVDNVDLRKYIANHNVLGEVLLDFFCTHLTSLSDCYNEVDNDEFNFF